MAVPPRLSEIIFTAILKTLAKISYPNVPAKINNSRAKAQGRLF
jgi:hypothetical protein